MSKESLITLAEALQKDRSLREKILSASTLAEKAAIATQNGHAVTADELKSTFGPDSNQGVLPDAELTNVAGGQMRRDPGKTSQTTKSGVTVCCW